MVLNQLLNLFITKISQRAQKKERKYDAYLVGYYGMQNSGDDALMLASMMGAKNELKAEKLIVSVNQLSLPLVGKSTVNLLRQNQMFFGQNRLAHYRAAMNSQKIIFGGGSVFHTAQDIEIKRHMMMLCSGDESMAVGVSLGPFADQRAKEQCKKFLTECYFVGVRDKESLRLAKTLVPKANVKLTFDLAPLVTLAPEFIKNTTAKGGILINVCPVPKSANGEVNTHEQEQLICKMEEVITRTWSQTRLPITLISLNGHSKFGDDSLCQRVLDRCAKHIPLQFLPYEPNPLKVIERIRSFHAFISMRLHGCVFGYLANTPVLALNYHNKCQQWCEQIGVAPSQRFDALTFNPSQVATTLAQGLQHGFSSPLLAVNDAVKLSLLNWRN